MENKILTPINTIESTQTGRCQCGEIRYESKSKPLALYICHCRECQKQSASAFGISLEVLSADFSVIKAHQNIGVALQTVGEDSAAPSVRHVVHGSGMNLSQEQKQFQLKLDCLTNLSMFPMQYMSGSRENSLALSYQTA